MKRFQNKNKSRNNNSHNNKNKNFSAEEDNEKYVIVVSNVESDFAKIHQNQLVSFCCLNPSLQRYNMHKQRRTNDKTESEPERGDVTVTEADGNQSDPGRPHCCYQLNCRLETHTAELQVYADSANTSIASIFNQKRPQQQKQQQQQPHHKRGREAEDENDHDNKEGEALLVQEDLRNLANDETNSAAAENAYVYNSLTSMVLQLQRKPYFHSFLNMYVTLPGYAEGDALVLENPSASAGHDGTEEGTEGGEEAKKEERTAKPVVRIKQFDGTQSELVSCPLQLSQARPQDAITHLLADLPGFVSLFPLHQSINNNNNNNNHNRRNPRNNAKAAQGVTTKSFRIVFQNKKYLFQAKHLLDQFELEGNLRVYLKLNDNLAKEEEVFRREEEEKGGLGSNHPISVIDDVNAEALPF